MIWALPILPMLVGLLVWGASRRADLSRRHVGAAALGTCTVMLGLAALGTWRGSSAAFAWGGGLRLQLAVTPPVAAVTLLVPAVAAAVLIWAVAHERDDGLERLVGLMLVFAGAMELLVLAADLLTLIVGWELVGALSWALIGHELEDDTAARDAMYAFNATRLGGLGLLLAAGAALAATGSFAFQELGRAAASPWGDLLAAGILTAAAAKSAQLPFSPWLFRAMAGPSSVSALLHSSTMVAAGAWLVIRLRTPLAAVPWFDTAAIALGLSTALAGGLVASLQFDAKRLLAASTSAHYGLMFAAVGAGATGAALAHLVTHAAFKSLLFLVAGTAITAASTHDLREMGLGSRLPFAAAASAVGALALAGLPPLGAAWSKDAAIAALGQVSPYLALAGIAAGALSAWYAGRFHFLAFGRTRSTPADPDHPDQPGTAERLGLGLLASATLLLSLIWLPAVSRTAADLLAIRWPDGKLWEKLLATAVALLAATGAGIVYHPHRSRTALSPHRRRLANWLAIPALLDRLVVRPTRAVAAACARFDDRVVDAGTRAARRLATALSDLTSRGLEVAVDALVRALVTATTLLAAASRRVDESGIDAGVHLTAHGVGLSGRWSRKTQTGALPRYYLYVTAALFLFALSMLIGR